MAVETEPAAPEQPSRRLKNLRPPFPKGVSGNPGGRPRIEPRVRRYARTYDRAMCRTLAELAQDPKVPPSERRRAAMDLIAVGSGRPALVQEIAGRDGQPVGPLVNLNIGMGMAPGQLSPSQCYELMVRGAIEADPQHPAFQTERSPVTVDGQAAEEKADK